jgi:hypothetical protein
MTRHRSSQVEIIHGCLTVDTPSEVIMLSRLRMQPVVVVSDSVPERDVVLVWVPSGRKPTEAEYAKGEPWADLNKAIVHAGEIQRQDGMTPWIRYDKKFVFSPEDVFAAYAQLKEGG